MRYQRLALGTIGIGIISGLSTSLGCPVSLTNVLLGCANFWLGVYWARDSISEGTMQVPGTAGVGWVRWKSLRQMFSRTFRP